MYNVKLEYWVDCKPEYLVNMLSKHNVNIMFPKHSDEGSKMIILSKDKQKVEKLLKDYGKNFYLKKEIGQLINLQSILKKYVFWMGCLLSILLLLIYSSMVVTIQVEGCNLIDEKTIKSIVKNDDQRPIFITQKDMKLIKENVLKLDGIAYVETIKNGTTLNINVVEELSKTEIIDTQNINSIKAKESGIIVKILVYGGTSLVSVGDKVERGQELIAPYHIKADGETKQTLAIGVVEAKVSRVIELRYEGENDYKNQFMLDYELQTIKFKQSLQEGDKFLGSQFFVKNIDKTIVCSIYYDILTRIS